MSTAVARAIESSFVSPNELDSNFESANVVDGLYMLVRAINGGLHALAAALREACSQAGGDGTALATLAVSISKHAEAVESLADAVSSLADSRDSIQETPALAE